MVDGKIRLATDTIPHLAVIILGSIITYMNSILMGVIYTLIVIVGMFWFWGSICTKCKSYGHPACPSGYGTIAAKLFKKKEGDFGKAFKRNIISVAFQWFIPFGVGIYDLIFNTSVLRIVIWVIFTLAAFVYLPLAAKKKGCSTCPQQNDCPFKK